MEAIAAKQCNFNVVPIFNLMVSSVVARTLEQLVINAIYGSSCNHNDVKSVGFYQENLNLTVEIQIEISAYLFLLAANAIGSTSRPR